MNSNVKKQILSIRYSGRTNMFDTKMVQYLANEYGFYDLVVFLEEHKKEYVRFIMTGEEQKDTVYLPNMTCYYIQLERICV